jgi:hypothetical protein
MAESTGWAERGRELADGDIPEPAWIERGKEIVGEGHA